MEDNLKIEVTPNVKKCLEVLADAFKKLPNDETKKQAEGAIAYLEMTFKGKPQPMGGRICPSGSFFIAGGL